MTRRLLPALFIALCAAAAPASAANRLALVVGNDAYANLPPLAKAANDARAVEATLESLGFAVTRIENAGRREMSEALRRAVANVAPGDTVFFFYAGHGQSFAGRNYLIPTDMADLGGNANALASGLEDDAFAAGEVINRFRRAGAGLVVAVLDACRDSPFATATRGAATRGLARIKADDGVFVIYSAGEEERALDGLGPKDEAANSVFTRTFLPLLARTDLSLQDIAVGVKRKVSELAASVGESQRPAYYDELLGKTWLLGAPTEPDPEIALPVPSDPAPPPETGPAVAVLPPAADAPPERAKVERWQTVINVGGRRYLCINEADSTSTGRYRLSDGCPPPFAGETGWREIASNGTWRLLADNGRVDFGSIEVIGPGRIRVKSLGGAAIWERLAD